MKALTLHQPWASLVALGVKTIETRSWSTPYRGPLAIHAGAKRFGFSSETAEFVRSWPLDVYRRVPRSTADAEICDNYPLGAIVATCTLVDVAPTADLYWTGIWRRWAWQTSNGAPLYPPQADPAVKGLHVVLPADQRPYGDFTPGRYAWLLSDIVPLSEPIPAKGKQGLWGIDDQLLAAA